MRFDIQNELPDAMLVNEDGWFKGLNQDWREVLDGRPPIGINELPVFDLRKLMIHYDIRKPEEQERWDFKHRMCMLADEEDGLDPFSTWYDRQATKRANAQSGEELQHEHGIEPTQDLQDRLADLSFDEVKQVYSKMLHEKHNGDATKAAKAAGVKDKRTIDSWWTKYDILPS
jgi:hypothetical protein